MINSLENQSFIPTGREIVLYNDQEAQNWRKCPNNIITAEPLTWCRPQEESGAIEGDGSTRKRKRGNISELEVEKEKEFTLLELYKSNNINEIISRRQKDETTIDPKELLKNLKGWTVEKRKRTEKNGKDRVDKTYRHPKSKKILRSLVEVKRFIEENSCTGETSDNGEGGSQDAQSNIYLQIFKRWEETFGNGAQETFNNSSKQGSSSSGSEQREAVRAPKTAWGTTFKSHDTVDLSLHSQRPFHYQERMNEKWNVVPQAEQISDSSKQQVFSNLMRSSGQECVRTFGVGLPPCDVFGASSSLTNITSVDEMKLLVQSQVEAQIEARVAAHVAERISHYEKTQREMAQRMESMHRLLVLQGMLPPSQFPNTRRF